MAVGERVKGKEICIVTEITRSKELTTNYELQWTRSRLVCELSVETHKFRFAADIRYRSILGLTLIHFSFFLFLFFTVSIMVKWPAILARSTLRDVMK